jgi:hypothetical protein
MGDYRLDAFWTACCWCSRIDVPGIIGKVGTILASTR